MSSREEKALWVGEAFTIPISELKTIKSSFTSAARNLKSPFLLMKYNAAKKWSQKTGLSPIFITKDILKSDSGKAVLRHEMIHAAHLSDPSNPVFTNVLKRTPSLSSSIEKEISHTSSVKENIREGYAQILHSLNKVDKSKARFMLESERLAWGYQRKPSFLKQLELSGIKTHRTVARVMESGTGSAVVNAGTSTIKSILKSTSRIIKNSL